jgi:putative salt-induced outer membrane protein YdiY
MLICGVLLGLAAPALAGGPDWLLPQPEEATEPGQITDAAAPPPPDPDSWFKGWTGSVELGLNGSEGNTETLSFLGRIQGLRDVSDYSTSFDLSYFTKRDDGELTEDRFDSMLRNDWKINDSPWRFWAQARFQYDGFKEWDSRLSLFAGPGYVFVDDGETFLMGRAGLGATKEFGGERNEWQPEGLLGVDFSRQLTERQKINATVEYIPSLQHIQRYRLRGKADWELLVDPEISMSLKVGVEDEYNSDPPGDDKRNDFRYYVLLVWSF